LALILIVLLPFAGALLPGLMIRAGAIPARGPRRRSPPPRSSACSCTPRSVRRRRGGVPTGLAALDRPEFQPVLDGLGFLFAGLILGIGLLIILYARFYLGREDPMGQFYAYLLLFQGAMVGIVLSDNILLLLVFWELTFALVIPADRILKHLPEGRQGARMALAVTGMGGLALVGGMLILGEIAGSYDLTVILQSKDLIQASPLYLPALLLILIGCFTKSAQFSFSFLAAACHGGAHSGFRLSPLGHHGEGRAVPHGAPVAGARRHTGMVSTSSPLPASSPWSSAR